MNDNIDRDMAPQSAAERIPNELWDKVFKYFIPTKKDRT